VLERLSRHGPPPEGRGRPAGRGRADGRRRRRHAHISGTNHPLIELEAELADLHGKDAALVFTSGFVSNEASIATISRLLPDCLILSDQLNHASMIEGVRRSGRTSRSGAQRPGPPGSLLKAAGRDRAKLIVFESVYSMDGDIAPIRAIADLAESTAP
jgi:5-aminolevulinate synthase